jgi:hypothetical protein
MDGIQQQQQLLQQQHWPHVELQNGGKIYLSIALSLYRSHSMML